MPNAVIIPTLAYADVRRAVEWLCDCFGFVERLAIGTHRAQLDFGGGAIVVTHNSTPGAHADPTHSIMVRVENLDGHHARCVQRGVRILQPPTDFPYGERQYSVQDIGGHVWTFSQTIADSDPAVWGGELKHG